ncbi:B3GT4 galactosyltransferase, partial [Rhinopomastus cyanomelas]|nr:B3GT4 galactosyltransferase [Rhinopomastus cyanomelas]
AGGPRWSLAAESRRFGDLLQGPFADSYPTLVHKTLFLLRWAAARCPGASFVLKADDDVFVNLPALTGYLRRAFRSLPPLYLGRVHWRVPAQRDPRHRHHVPPA